MTTSGSPLLRDSSAVCVYGMIVACASVWCASILLAPLWIHGNGTLHAVADFLYDTLHRICHQRDDHSFHLGGEKLGVCIRCTSIYFSFFTTLLALPALQRYWPRLLALSRGWLIAAMTPMVVDVGLSVAGVHDSTTTTRILSGALFGIVVALFIVPPALEAGRMILIRKRIPSTIIPTE